MDTQPVPICGEHHVQKEWRPVTFEYGEQDILIRVPNIYAWVCPVNGEASFTPETMDEIILTARELLETARRARERRSVLTEYIRRYSRLIFAHAKAPRTPSFCLFSLRLGGFV